MLNEGGHYMKEEELEHCYSVSTSIRRFDAISVSLYLFILVLCFHNKS